MKTFVFHGFGCSWYLGPSVRNPLGGFFFIALKVWDRAFCGEVGGMFGIFVWDLVFFIFDGSKRKPQPGRIPQVAGAGSIFPNLPNWGF